MPTISVQEILAQQEHARIERLAQHAWQRHGIAPESSRGRVRRMLRQNRS